MVTPGAYQAAILVDESLESEALVALQPKLNRVEGTKMAPWLWTRSLIKIIFLDVKGRFRVQLYKQPMIWHTWMAGVIPRARARVKFIRFDKGHPEAKLKLYD